MKTFESFLGPPVIMTIYFFIFSKTFSKNEHLEIRKMKKKTFQVVQSVTDKTTQKHLCLWGPPQMGGGFEWMLKKIRFEKNNFEC